MSKLNNKNILIILTGSIACYKACTVISQLKQKGHAVKVVLSPSSLEFIGKSTIEGLTGEPPITDMYSCGHVMDHINLARWADLVLVAPATANYINKISHGIGDDLLTTLFLSHDFEKPFLVAPAMNTKMYLHPVTQASIEKLKQMGIEILETASGILACGEIGSGRLLEPDLIIKEVEKFLTKSSKADINKATPPKKIKVLITSGGTSEPIDDVRFITNRSTGATAATIANSLSESGLEVTYLHSQNAARAQSGCKHFSYETFSDLQTLLITKLKETHYDYVVHAAAVSDYSLPQQTGKIDSEPRELTLTLIKNPKLINEIKKISPQTKLFAFKLTSAADETLINKKISALFNSSGCNYVIHNDWADIKNKNYKYRFFSNNLNFKNVDDLQSLSALIFQEIVTTQERL